MISRVTYPIFLLIKKHATVASAKKVAELSRDAPAMCLGHLPI